MPSTAGIPVSSSGDLVFVGTLLCTHVHMLDAIASMSCTWP
jgi:hypothetical protein